MGAAVALGSSQFFRSTIKAIEQFLAKVSIRIIYFGCRSRFLACCRLGELALETTIPYTEVRKLLAKGHRISTRLGGYGGYQAIRVDENGTYYGATESRKDGQAAGY